MFETALLCLALNVYHEARDQPVYGMQAVAEVVLNRVHDRRFPDTVCEVVKQGYATHYHSVDVLPSWAQTKIFTGKIKDHLFYRWPIR